MQNHSKGIIYAILTAVCWGFLAIGLKIAARKIDSATIVWFRFSVAFVVLAIWQAFKNPGDLAIFLKPPLLLVFATLALSVNYFTFMIGIHYTSPSIAQVFIQTGPILLATAGFVFFKEKLKLRQVIGFTLAIVGFLVFFNQQIINTETGGEKFMHGVTFILISGSAWATFAVFQKILVTRHSASSLNLFLFGLPILIFLPFVRFQPLFTLSWIWWLILILVGLNTLIAYTFIAKALHLTEANKVSIIIILNPIITFITMDLLTAADVTWIDHEVFNVLTIAGAILVLTGSIMVAFRKRNRIRIEKQPEDITPV